MEEGLYWSSSLTQGPDAPLRPSEKAGGGTVTISDFGGSYLPSKH